MSERRYRSGQSEGQGFGEATSEVWKTAGGVEALLEQAGPSTTSKTGFEEVIGTVVIAFAIGRHGPATNYAQGTSQVTVKSSPIHYS